jgi:hypothetical protein
MSAKKARGAKADRGKRKLGLSKQTVKDLGARGRARAGVRGGAMARQRPGGSTITAGPTCAC